jgi:hypothetical protein
MEIDSVTIVPNKEKPGKVSGQLYQSKAIKFDNTKKVS